MHMHMHTHAPQLLTEPDVFPRLLLQIPQRSFQMVLVDKQGMDKQRYPFPITAAELFTTIDTFPLRKDEMLLQQEAGQTCQS